MVIEQLKDRQTEILPDFSSKVALVIGIGGIGSWVAVDLALVGVGTIIMYDKDKIELTNLNRTLFKQSQIGEYKTKAVTELIAERRTDVIVISFEEIFQPGFLKKFASVDYIFDCTDTTRLKDDIRDTENYEDLNYVKLGYDGMDGTLSFNDFESGKWGEDNSYTVVPSFFGTPQLLSALAVTEMLTSSTKPKQTISLDMEDILSELKKIECSE